MNPGTKSVFLSYASQDAEAARGICDALRKEPRFLEIERKLHFPD